MAPSLQNAHAMPASDIHEKSGAVRLCSDSAYVDSGYLPIEHRGHRGFAFVEDVTAAGMPFSPVDDYTVGVVFFPPPSVRPEVPDETAFTCVGERGPLQIIGHWYLLGDQRLVQRVFEVS